MTILWSRHRPTSFQTYTGILSIAVFAGLTYAGLALNMRIRASHDTAGEIASVKEALPKGQRLVSLGAVDHRFVYYFKQPITLLPWPNDAATFDPDVSYFCFNLYGGRQPPFPWEEVAVVDCHRFGHPQALRKVAVGRRILNSS